MNKNIEELLHSNNADDRILAVNMLYTLHGDEVVTLLRGDPRGLDNLSICIEFNNIRVWLHKNNTTHCYNKSEIDFPFETVKKYSKRFNFRIVDNREYE